MRKLGFMLNDLPLERILILGVEGKKTNEHLVHDDADGPPVRCKGITFAFDQLWSKVGCNFFVFVAQNRILLAINLSHAEVNYFEIASLIKE